VPVLKTYRTEALVLKNHPLGEADLLVVCYTRESGKVRATARAARKVSSRLVGHLEPLTLVNLSLTRGRTLDQVAQAQVADSFPALRNALPALSRGLYVAELLDGFGSEASPNPELYSLALEVLAGIGRSPESDLPLRYFELRLLETSGLLPELYQCVECRKPLVPGDHRFTPNGGGTLCSQCAPLGAHLRPLSVRTLKVLRLLHRQRLAEIPSLTIDHQLAQELKATLTASVEHWLDQQVRSSAFLDHLRRTTPAEPATESAAHA